MTLGQAALSMGLHGLSILSKNQEVVKAVSKHTGGLGTPFAGIAAEVIFKGMDKLPGMLNQLRHASPGSVDPSVLFMEKPGLPTGIANAYLKQVDSNQDGAVSKEELQEHLKRLNESLEKLASRGASSIPESVRMQALQSAQEYTSRLMAQYDQVASLDGQVGISHTDLHRLAAQDGKPGQISQADWGALLS